MNTITLDHKFVKTKIRFLILFLTISLTCTNAKAVQATEVIDKITDSTTLIKESATDKTNRVKPDHIVDQKSEPVQPLVEKGVKKEINKVENKYDSQKIEQNSEQPDSKTTVQKLKKTAAKEKKTFSKKTDSTQSGKLDTDLGSKPTDTTKETSKAEVSDKQADELNALDSSKTEVDPPKAKNVDLKNPILESDIVSPEIAIKEKSAEKDESNEGIESEEKVVESAIKEQIEIEVHDKPFLLLGAEVPPATSTRLAWSPNHSFQGISGPTPVLVVNGVKPGPVLCLTAAVHGDELNGIEMVRRVLYNLKVEELSGTVIGVPIVNLQGFRRSSRYLPDRRDLNRFFPGTPYGSSASRIAYSFFNEIISHCNALVDLHTGSFHRTNLPQLRADLSNSDVVDITQGFGSTVIIQSKGAKGTLRRAAVDMGIPAVTLEAGEPMRLQDDQVSHGVKAIQTLMNQLGMYDYSNFWGDPEPVYYKSQWIRANQGGILFSQVDLGKKVKRGESLGTITDPITNVRSRITSPYDGRIIGMALNQVVMPGFAAFHVGIQKTEKEASKNTDEVGQAPANHISEIDTDKQQQVVESKELTRDADQHVDSE